MRLLLPPAVAALSLVVSSAGAQQAPVFRAGIDLVNLGVTVSDRKDKPVADLLADDFELYEDGRRQTIRYFAAGVATPGPELHLGVLLDVSESMEDDIAFTKTASIKFLNRLIDAADITVVDFDTEVRVARYTQDEFPRLVERIRGRKAGGLTALYDAVGVYLDGAAQLHGRTVMLLYTDGGDTGSALSLRELMNLLKASDVTVYAIGAMEHQVSSSREHQRMLLDQLASATGGRAFFPLTVKQIDSVYEQVLAEIRAQYMLGYVSTNEGTDGTWRKVEVKVRPGAGGGRGLKVRARPGYYAPRRTGIGIRD